MFNVTFYWYNLSINNKTVKNHGKKVNNNQEIIVLSMFCSN